MKERTHKQLYCLFQDLRSTEQQQAGAFNCMFIKIVTCWRWSVNEQKRREDFELAQKSNYRTPQSDPHLKVLC
ncbi:hypothetical protein Y1Q_0024289 [Alligator mississippiensis]|uniref:Uncharacterized protein n=1 Tax=Alligator mississippiensis TaxID=8496 RepID=A0A151NJ90_ALLMI|nr:hypothetical protein Y1Q_0024289 [Alligator mississippiensis]